MITIHPNAALTPRQREEVFNRFKQGVSLASLARQYHCSEKTVSKWVRRLRDGESPNDRSSRPRTHPRRTHPKVEQAILRLRAERRLGPHRIGWKLKVPPSTTYRVLQRNECSVLPRPRAKRLHTRRYEWAEPGDLVHIDIASQPRFTSTGLKFGGNHKLSQGKIGYDHTFAAIDDCTRFAFVQIRPNTRKATAVSFLHDLIASYARKGITVRRIMTDNGNCFIAKDFKVAAASLGIKIIYTPINTP